MGNRTRVQVATLITATALCAACAPDPSLEDPYAANGYFWPYGDGADGSLGGADSEGEGVSCPAPEEPLGELPDGTPILPLSACDGSPEGDFGLCASFNESGELQASWAGANGFAIFVTEPQAVIPMAPNTPVSEGRTFWSIGPIEFPSDGFSSPLTYQELPEGMKDVTADHGGPEGGIELDSGRCYKVTVLNTAFQRASVVVGWE